MIYEAPSLTETTARSLEEWKRKFQTEAKVNQELGRRLREMKKMLEEQTALVQTLQHQEAMVVEPEHDVESSCSRCVQLEAEVVKLKRLFVEQHTKQENNEEVNNAMLEPLTESASQSQRSSQNRTNSILYRDMLENLTPREPEDTDSPANVKPTTPTRLPPPPLAAVHQNRRHTTAIPLTRALLRPSPKTDTTNSPTPTPTKKEGRGSNQSHHQTQHSTTAFAGIEDASLGDLLKYVLVLSGPMPPKPKRNNFTASINSLRMKAADFRRTRSTAEVEASTKPLTPRHNGLSAAASTGSSTPNVIVGKSLHDFIHEEPTPARTRLDSMDKLSTAIAPGSPMKRPGWLANIFRGTSTDAPPVSASAPSTPTAATAPPPSTTSPTKLNATSGVRPKLLTVYPPPKHYNKDKSPVVPELEGLVEICFPYGERLPSLSDFSLTKLRRTLQERHRTYRSPDATFVLTIPSPSGNPTELMFAVCVQTPLFPDEDNQDLTTNDLETDDHRLPTHGCLCLVSPYPFFSLFFKVLFGIATMWESQRREHAQELAIALKEKRPPPRPPLTLTDFINHFTTIVMRLNDLKVPAMGGWSRLMLAPEFTPLSFHRPHSESISAERQMLVLEYAAPVLFSLLSVDQVLFLLGCLCCERKVLVVSDHANIVSSCVLALIALLEPLQWAGPVITLLPPRLDELLEAPVPLIAGRVSMATATPRSANFSTLDKPMHGVIEMNMDQNNLCMHEEDLMCYHELKLPGSDLLVHELQPWSTQLFERHVEDDYPSILQVQASEMMCTRIHRHMQSICALAMGETTTLDLACSPPQPHTLDTSSRCSETVLEYIRRFQDTQMFSMFQMQRQNEEQEAQEL